jgi:hypothetical protein
VKVRVFATSRYEKEVRRLLAESEQAAMQLAIAADAEAHPVVPGTGGVWKAAKKFVEGLKDAKKQAGK